MASPRFLVLGALALAACGSDLTISPTALPNGAVGLPYHAVLTSTGNTPISWKLTQGVLPGGVILSDGSGSLDGTPTTAGTFSFSVESTESATFHSNNGKESYTLTILPKLVAPASVPVAEAGQSYSQVVTATGGVGPYRIDVKGLPSHFQFNATTNTIIGDPTFAGSYELEIDVTDSGSPQQAAVSTPTLTVKPVQVSIGSTSPLANAPLNQPYSVTLQTENGAGPFQWSVTSGALPTGLDLNPSTGTISGTPTQTGTATFTLNVADLGSPPDSATQQFSLTVQ